MPSYCPMPTTARKDNAVRCVEISRTARTPQRWLESKANAWYRAEPWLVGANYIPANAINQLEIWQTKTFDPQRIDKELAWAEGLGMNTMRVFLHHLLWEQDAPKGVGAFAGDRRVLAWDVWNEPDNTKDLSYGHCELADKTERVALLLPNVFASARSIGTEQPLTSGVWIGDWSSFPQAKFDTNDPARKLRRDLFPQLRRAGGIRDPRPVFAAIR
jgi:hypothetical protein